MPKSYPPEFRRRAVELCRAGAAASKFARDLGVSEATIYVSEFTIMSKSRGLSLSLGA